MRREAQEKLMREVGQRRKQRQAKLSRLLEEENSKPHGAGIFGSAVWMLLVWAALITIILWI